MHREQGMVTISEETKPKKSLHNSPTLAYEAGEITTTAASLLVTVSVLRPVMNTVNTAVVYHERHA